jgi:hypothetical protein
MASYDYAVIRIVPRVEREEFLNVGVILFCRTQRYLRVRIELDHDRLASFAPGLDQSDLIRNLRAIERVGEGGPDAGPIGELTQSERFHWLAAPRSAIIQVSPIHTGLCEDPAAALDHLIDVVVRPPLPDCAPEGELPGATR